MSQDQHYNLADKHLPELLADRKGTDMPAARSMLVIILGMIVAFAVISTLLLDRVETDAIGTPPAQQELLP